MSVRDRRANPRFVCDLDANVEIQGREGWIDGRAIDLSFSGICVQIAEAVPVGSHVTFHLQLVLPSAESERLPLPGTVVWATPTRGSTQIGARFQATLDDAYWQKLDLMLRILSGELTVPTVPPED